MNIEQSISELVRQTKNEELTLSDDVVDFVIAKLRFTEKLISQIYECSDYDTVGYLKEWIKENQ